MSSFAKVAVLISGGGTNLRLSVDRLAAGELPHVELALVVSSRKNAGGLDELDREKIGIWQGEFWQDLIKL